MESVSYWKILRVLTTDTCNFRCVFCHNEGQERSRQRFLNLDDLKKVIAPLSHRPIREIQFSGGEPFLNSQTIEMIEWVDKYTKYEIGCATNLSMIDESSIERLAKTRVSLNIQFPACNQKDYKNITGYKGINDINSKLLLLKKYDVVFKLNYVWINGEIDSLKTILAFCIKNSFGLKILPYISSKTLTENTFKETAIDYLYEFLGEGKIKKGGSVRWEMKNNDDDFVIKYVDNPCFTKDHSICKEYAELRLLPNLELQTCLLKSNNVILNKEDLCESNKILSKMDLLWNNFTNC